jgi:nucleoside-diphosphate-sugar epimerase
MNILILGGTRFVGRHIAEAALARGHDVALFNRGQSDPEPGLEVERLRGNRDGDLTALRGRRWDAVIDVSGYVPRIVRASVELLASVVDHYTFISTASVYAAPKAEDRIDERAPIRTIKDEGREDYQDPAAYGALKALCERIVERAMPDQAFVPRLSLVVGPRDPTDRFTYWPRRVARGGLILGFDSPDRVVLPFIDARDLARWIVAGVEAGLTGAYNVGGEMGVTIGGVLETCRVISRVGDASFVWASEAFLLEHGVKPWTGLPLWVPRGQDDLAGLDSTKALAEGLRLRPLAKTIADTLEWDRTRPGNIELLAGLAVEREAELLQLWQAAQGPQQGRAD